MKGSIIIQLSLCLGLITNAQDVVQWKYSAKKIADKTYEVHFTPVVKLPWHIYSLKEPDNGALPTSFYFDKNPLIVMEGKVKEIGLQKDFVQIVKLKTNVKTFITGEVEFMACNNKQCLPPETISFNIALH